MVTKFDKPISEEVSALNEQIDKQKIISPPSSVTSLAAIVDILNDGEERTFAVNPTTRAFTDWPAALNDYMFYAFITVYKKVYAVIDIIAVKTSDGKTKRILGYRTGANNWVWQTV